MDSSQFGSPTETLSAALERLQSADCAVVRRSSWYRSAPLPRSDQPWFVNGVAELATELSPPDLLARLHSIEAAFGRRRTVPNAARPVDLDLLVYHDEVTDTSRVPVVPHPRMVERAFVLLPLLELVPDWIDPRSGRPIGRLIEELPPGQECYRLDPSRS